MIKQFLVKKMEGAFSDSYKFMNAEIVRYVTSVKKRPVRILDIGSGSGEVTTKYLAGLDEYEIHGLDVVRPEKNPQIIFTECNLEDAVFPFEDNSFDIVIAGQTIEHLINKDALLEQSYRVLKTGGFFICSTENIASFDNILSLVLGQEPQVQNTGSKLNTSSFLSPNYMRPVGPNGNKYLHKNVNSYCGLQRLCKVNGFKNLKIKSFGNIVKIIEKIFPIYNRVLVVYGVKN